MWGGEISGSWPGGQLRDRRRPGGTELKTPGVQGMGRGTQVSPPSSNEKLPWVSAPFRNETLVVRAVLPSSDGGSVECFGQLMSELPVSIGGGRNNVPLRVDRICLAPISLAFGRVLRKPAAGWGPTSMRSVEIPSPGRRLER
jgi:hypothetical protein